MTSQVIDTMTSMRHRGDMSITAADASDLFRRDPDEFIDLGDGAIAYRRVGTGPDVLFVHGWPVSGATFRCLLPHLAEHVTCHVVDLLGAGSSRFDERTELSIERHIDSVRRVIDWLGVDSISVVGHDSGGMIARHAVAGDARLRGLGLIDTEPSGGVGWRFRMFVSIRHVPGFARVLGWLAGRPRLRRNKFVFGDAVADRSLLDGEFDEFFLTPLHEDPQLRAAAGRLLSSFRFDHVEQLAELQARIEVPVALVWGDQDPFFPVAAAREMVGDFPNATLTEIPGVGLFSHEEDPAAVAAALLPVLTR